MDYQALGVAFAAISASIGALVTGVYTGRNSRAKDQSDARSQLETARFARDQAEEEASRKRIEAIAKDAADARKRARDLEDEFDKRYTELRAHSQRGWDLASYHFGLVSFLGHLLNNIFAVVEMGAGRPDATLLLMDVVKNAQSRMRSVRLPVSLEEPILYPDKRPGSPEPAVLYPDNRPGVPPSVV